MKSALFLILISAPAFASSNGWQLNLLVFSSAEGHMNDTYLAEFRLPAKDANDCNAQGNNALRYFKSAHLPDNSVSLAGFSCEPAP